MPRRKTPFVKGEYYHVYSRGNSKQEIFHDEEDRKRFTALLYACNQEGHFKIDHLLKGESLYNVNIKDFLAAIGCYCLMPNHFHLLVTPLRDGSVSKFMQKVMVAYVMYYNKKYKRTGGLFEGSFKVQPIVNEIHLKYIFAYIHLNILKLIDPRWKEGGIKDNEKAVSYLKQYRYSSLPDYLGFMRIEGKIIKREFFPDYFPTPEKVWKEIFDWMNG
jgi:putative transposase